MPRIRQVSTDERMVKYHIQEYERCLKTIFPICSSLAGRQVDKSFAIMDVKGAAIEVLVIVEWVSRCGILSLDKGCETDVGNGHKD